MNQDFDAVLIVSFGGPEGMNEVMPFLENVLRGKNVPRERMLEVAHHYEIFGGVSPINAQCRALVAALRKELAEKGPRLSVYWGNRNWHPLLADTVRQMARDGIKNALAFVTSAYSSYSGCRQYLENIASAREEVGPLSPRIEKLRPFFNHPCFIEANVASVGAALNQIPAGARADTHIAFTAHSIPQAMADNCSYEAQLLEACALVSEGVGKDNCWRLVFQSRSGPPSQPWLGPDINDHLRELKASRVTDVVVTPIGFISDHMEVLYDLDTEARTLAEELGLRMVRAATSGTHPSFIKMVRALIIERIEGSAMPQLIGARGASVNSCAPGCCLPGVTGPRAEKVSS